MAKIKPIPIVDLYLTGLPALRMRAYSLRMQNKDELVDAAKKIDITLPAEFILHPIFIQADDKILLEMNHTPDYLVAIVVSDLIGAEEWVAKLTEAWGRFESAHCAIISNEKVADELKDSLPAHMHERIIVADTSFEGVSHQVMQLIFSSAAYQKIPSKKTGSHSVENPKPTPKYSADAKQISASLESSKIALAAGANQANLQAAIDALMQINGALSCAVVDNTTGAILASKSKNSIALDIAAQGYASILKASTKALQLMGVDDQIEDVVSTSANQYHIAYPLNKLPHHFIYFLAEKNKANLALARLKVQEIAGKCQY